MCAVCIIYIYIYIYIRGPVNDIMYIMRVYVCVRARVCVSM